MSTVLHMVLLIYGEYTTSGSDDLKGMCVCSTIGILVHKDNLINYQLLIIYQLLIRTFTYQPTVDKTIVLSTKIH
jgi:hypothetical protein